MRITGDMLFGLLSKKCTLERFGKGSRTRELSLPTFWRSGDPAEAGRIYVARTDELGTRPPEGCVFVCCGMRPSKVWNSWPCDIIYVKDAGVGIMDAFNLVQAVLDRLITWETRMRQLQSSGASVRDLVEASIPIFENRVTVCDYELRILATCESDVHDPMQVVRMNDKLERVPANLTTFFMDSRFSMIRRREPYFLDVPGSTQTYCINFHLGETYIGSCSIQDTVHPLEEHDLKLFQMFAGYVRETLALQARTMGNQLVTARTVFEQLLNGYPVSKSDMEHALRMIELSMGGRSIRECKWCCVVIRNARGTGQLPDNYLCTTVESILPNATALVVNGSIVAFCVLANNQHRAEEIGEVLEAFLVDMGFRAGVSRTFIDPFGAEKYYRQALCAVETGFEVDQERHCHLFGDIALDYMLDRVTSELELELLVPPELVRLYRHNSPDVDYVGTLKAFLDNDCKITKTANALYLHRTTLVKRLEKIRSIVNLDDADRCLYLRICLHLPDIERALEGNSDVSDIG